MFKRPAAKHRPGTFFGGSMDLAHVIGALADCYGPRGWWPLPSRGGAEGRNEGGYLPTPSLPVGPGGDGRMASARFEIAVGAILAQNTAWRGASKAVAAVATAGILSPTGILNTPDDQLAELLRPAGTYRRKAQYVRNLAECWPEIDSAVPTRQYLLGLTAFGPETADCVLLYCYGVPVFVADAYARRIFSRLGLVGEKPTYERARAYAEANLPREPAYLAEAHALLVEHAKRRCKARPACSGCPFGSWCPFGRSIAVKEA